ncbi:MAG: hypothetical protein HQL19_08445 [Candidatus Omnitrophica bacterium]|nr:hypothetical protein [Candidatus Omnitrophota bacterium]
MVKQLFIMSLVAMFLVPPMPVPAFAAPKVAVAIIANGGQPYEAILHSIQETLGAKLAAQDILVIPFEKEMLKDPVQVQAALKKNGASVLVAVGTSMAKIAQKAGMGMPIVFTMVLGPDRSGVVPPGISMDIPYAVKLKEASDILGRKIRAGVIYSENSLQEVEKIKDGCVKAGCELSSVKVEGEKDFPDAVAQIMKDSDVILMIADSKIYFPRSVEFLLGEALKNKVPVIGLSAAYTKAGALLAFDCDYTDLGRQTADVVLDILNGKVPTASADPERVVYSVNIQVAKRIGVVFSEKILKSAEKVFGE